MTLFWFLLFWLTAAEGLVSGQLRGVRDALEQAHVRAALDNRASRPVRLLVFGLDAALASALVSSKLPLQSVFLDSDAKWVRHVRKRRPDLEFHNDSDSESAFSMLRHFSLLEWPHTAEDRPEVLSKSEFRQLTPLYPHEESRLAAQAFPSVVLRGPEKKDELEGDDNISEEVPIPLYAGPNSKVKAEGAPSASSVKRGFRLPNSKSLTRGQKIFSNDSFVSDREWREHLQKLSRPSSRINASDPFFLLKQDVLNKEEARKQRKLENQRAASTVAENTLG